VAIRIWIQGSFSGVVTTGRYGKWSTDINRLLILIRQTAAVVRRVLAEVCTVSMLLVHGCFHSSSHSSHQKSFHLFSVLVLSKRNHYSFKKSVSVSDSFWLIPIVILANELLFFIVLVFVIVRENSTAAHRPQYSSAGRPMSPGCYNVLLGGFSSAVRRRFIDEWCRSVIRNQVNLLALCVEAAQSVLLTASCSARCSVYSASSILLHYSRV